MLKLASALGRRPQSIDKCILIFLGTFLLSSFSKAADTVTIAGNNYKISTNTDAVPSWLSGDDVETNTIYQTGVNGVFCNIQLFQYLLKNHSGAEQEKEVLLYDQTKNCIVKTGIIAVAFNGGILGYMASGKLLDSSNSRHFASTKEFIAWVRASTNN